MEKKSIGVDGENLKKEESKDYFVPRNDIKDEFRKSKSYRRKIG